MNSEYGNKYYLSTTSWTIYGPTGRQAALQDSGSVNPPTLLMSGQDIDLFLGTTFLGGTVAARKATLDYLQCKIEMRCYGNFPAHVDLYWCQARMNIGSADALTRYQPNYAFANLFAQQQTDAGAVLHTLPGVHPYMNQSFCQTWRILRKRHYYLRPTRMALSTFRLKNVQLDYAQGTTVNGNTAVANKTIGILAIVRGGIGRLAAGGSSDSSPGQCQVLFTSYKTCRAKDMAGPINASSADQSLNFVNANTSFTTANKQIYPELDFAATPYAAAVT